MVAKTFLFYDLETTGLNKAFDQVLQFAAIRTDTHLNTLEEYEIDVGLTTGVIPSPGAMITHRLSLDTLSAGVPEIEAIGKIHQLLNEPGTVSCGYNTLSFDDEFLRFSFYRHLLSPYTHQYAHDCGRMDIYPMVVMYFLYYPEIIQWPADGLKLEDISQVNALARGQAHHAMTDVRATLALAKKLMAHQKMWQYLLGYFDKQVDQKRMMALASIGANDHGHQYREGILVMPKAGAKEKYQYPVLFLGSSDHYKNQTLWLRLDQLALMQTTPETIEESTWVVRKKHADIGFLLPITDRYAQVLGEERLALVEQNKRWLLNNPALLEQIRTYHCDYTYPEVPDVDVDAALYLRGFLSSEDTLLCEAFHRALPSDKPGIIDRFSDELLKAQAWRLMIKHYPEEVPPEQAEVFFAMSHAKDHRGEMRLTAEGAMAEIEDLRRKVDLDAEQQNLLDELEAYIVSI